MAASECSDETFSVDFEVISNEIDIDNVYLSKNNFFENSEIEVDDFSEKEIEELVAADQQAEIILQKIPELKFVDETLITTLTTEEKNKARHPAAVTAKCPKCNRLYKRPACLKTHIAICGGEVKKNKKKKQNVAKNKLSLTSKQKKKAGSDYVLPTNHEYVKDSEKFVLSALQTSISDYANNIKIPGIVTPGNKVVTLASVAVSVITESTESNNLLCQELVKNIADIVKTVNFKKPSSREKMWSELLSMVKKDYASTKFYGILKKKSPEYEEAIFCSLYQSICLEVLNSIMKYTNESRRTKITSGDLSMTNEENQILHYVAGYVVFSLSKKYKALLKEKPKNNIAIAVIEFLKSLKVSSNAELSGNTLAEYIEKWTKLVSRGYLVEVNKVMYEFIYKIEMVARNILNVNYIKTYRNEDLRDSLHQQISSNDELSCVWMEMSRNFPNEKLAIILKEQIFMKWIDLRANSFVICYVQMLKRKLAQTKKGEKISTSSEPALRKTLT